MNQKNLISAFALGTMVVFAFGSTGGSVDMSEFENVSMEPVAVSGSTAGGGAVGIAECDEYLKRMRCLMEKTGGDTSSLDTSADAWRQGAAYSKDTIQEACKTALTSAGPGFDSQGC